MRTPLSLIVALVGALLLAGCGGPTQDAPTGSAPTATTPAPALPVLSLRIPSIGVDAPLEDLRLDAAGALEVPPVTDPQVAGWYSLGVAPGDVGPAVILGHVSGRPPGAERSVPGVFARIHELAPGDRVEVVRDGRPLVFVVTFKVTVDKDSFPTEAVYSDTVLPELRLITCGGTFDPAAHSYESNVVVYATLA